MRSSREKLHLVILDIIEDRSYNYPCSLSKLWIKLFSYPVNVKNNVVKYYSSLVSIYFNSTEEKFR